MYDQSFNYISLTRMLRKNDFYIMPRLRGIAVKESEIESATERAFIGFEGHSFLSSTKLRGKDVYRIIEFYNEIILRKVDKNLKKALPLYPLSRDTIVANIKNLVSEGVQYGLYRLDIKSFYESLEPNLAIKKINDLKKLSPQTKKIIKDVLDHFTASGGKGIPRGLALSATLSEIVMASFDREIASTPGIFYYSRYVDDIIIITSGTENPKQFIKKISRQLPTGLFLNKKKEKACVISDSTPFKATPQKPTNLEILSFEYLGYKFKIFEPSKKFEQREVILDIADSKIKKIKTRIVKTIIDFCNNKNFELLEMRLKFLTSNFSIPDINRGGYRLAGIYHNYHRIDGAKSLALEELDKFIKLAVLSGAGKVFNDFYLTAPSAQRRKLAAFSFKRGFNEKIYLYFSRTQLMLIGECWKYA